MPELPKELVVTSRLRVPSEEFDFSFVRSSGPGGQNVNKVSSKAVLRWKPAENATLPATVRRRFEEKFAHRLTKEGELILSSQRYRDQQRNAEDVFERLRAMLRQVAAPPVKRRPTRPTKAAKERRLQQKKETGERKRQRQQKFES